MRAYYGSPISDNIIETPEGYLICKNASIGRLGSMNYLPEELKIDSDKAQVEVLRMEDDLFDIAALASFEGKPVTDNHPPVNIDVNNIQQYSKGHIENVRRGTGETSDHMVADLVIVDPILISLVKNGVKRELSSGYDCVYEKTVDGTIQQKQIRGNHVAIVDRGRAGSSVSIKDSAAAESSNPVNLTERRKPKVRNTEKPNTSNVGRVLRLFAGNVKDASTVDELNESVNDAVAMIDALSVPAVLRPQEGTPNAGVKTAEREISSETAIREARAKDESTTDEGKEDKTEAKDEMTLGHLAEMIRALGNGGMHDAPPVEVVEAAGAVKEDRIDQLLSDLVGDEMSAPNPPTNPQIDNEMAEQEEALTVPVETLNDAVSEKEDKEDKKEDKKTEAKDAAITILRNVKPALAAIKDSKTRMAVTDALCDSVKYIFSSAPSKMEDIVKTTQQASVKAMQDSASLSSPSFDLESRQAAYDKRNPHMRKGE